MTHTSMNSYDKSNQALISGIAADVEQDKTLKAW
jgi:hypothetical protein